MAAEPVIRYPSPFGGDFVDVVRASTVVFQKGWLVSIESATAVNMNADTEDVTFAGVAYTNHINGDEHDVTVLLKCILEIDVTTSTFILGAGVKYTSGSATALYTVVDDAGANTIGWSNQEYVSAVTRMEVRVDVPLLGAYATKLFTASA